MSDEPSDDLQVPETWTRDGEVISRAVEAPDFLAGIELVRRVALRAEEADHHPDVDVRWRTVTFRLTTHSEGRLTAKDVALATRIDAELDGLLAER